MQTTLFRENQCEQKRNTRLFKDSIYLLNMRLVVKSSYNEISRYLHFSNRRVFRRFVLPQFFFFPLIKNIIVSRNIKQPTDDRSKIYFPILYSQIFLMSFNIPYISTVSVNRTLRKLKLRGGSTGRPLKINVYQRNKRICICAGFKQHHIKVD